MNRNSVRYDEAHDSTIDRDSRNGITFHEIERLLQSVAGVVAGVEGQRAEMDAWEDGRVVVDAADGVQHSLQGLDSVLYLRRSGRTSGGYRR